MRFAVPIALIVAYVVADIDECDNICSSGTECVEGYCIATGGCCASEACEDDLIRECVGSFDSVCKDILWDHQCISEAVERCDLVCEDPCPPGPAQPLCTEAEVQAPRDLTTTISGEVVQGYKTPKAPVLSPEQTEAMLLTNVHFHKGCEHKTDQCSIDTVTLEWEASQERAANPRPGFMCPTDVILNRGEPNPFDPYEFQYCEGVEVGMTYEVHYVHSSAGVGDLDDGLGQAAGGRGLLNPMVSVQAMMFLIVNDDDPMYDDMDLVHGWDHTAHGDVVYYMGSTTGTGNDNTYCSPYTVSWHVDRQCHAISAQSFDNMCKEMKETYNMSVDLAPHGSRILLDPQFVVPANKVYAWSDVE